jgi:hypothetical protein
MNRRVFSLVAVFVFAAASAHAQAKTEQSAPPTQPPALTQNSAANPSTPQTPQPPQKKVWTNDELSGLDPHAGVSTVGKESGPTSKHVAPTKGHDAKWYQDQIAKLQAKIPPLDRQIAALEAALEGKPTGDAKRSTRPAGVKVDDWSRELAELQKKRDGTFAQISALQDQARHNGVAPNALP